MARERMKLPLLLILSLLLLSFSWAFLMPSSQKKQCVLSTRPPVVGVFSETQLSAKKKKKKKGNAGKGFGQAPQTTTPAIKQSDTMETSSTSSSSVPQMDQSSPSLSSETPSFLQSVETGGSDSIPQVADNDNNSSLPPEERTKQILREKYGLRTLQEQRMEDSLNAQKRKMEEWKQLANKGDDVDLLAAVPPPVLKGIDLFLKLGVGVSITAFVFAGLAITAEAWSKATGNQLPGNLNSIIADVIEPNFTYGLAVVLGFSISLGVFAAAQLGSSSAVYKEDN